MSSISSYSPSISRLWIVIAVGGLHTAPHFARAEHKIFDESVMKKWKAYEDFSHKLQGSARQKSTQNGKRLESTLRFRQNSQCALCGQSSQDPSTMIYQLCNPRYQAGIKLSKTDPSNAVLTKYEAYPSDPDIPTLVDFVLAEVSRHFAYDNTTRLWQVVSKPSFRVTKVAKEIQSGRELVRVDHIYDYENHNPKQANHRARIHGSLWLDPSRCWCIRRFTSSTETTLRDKRIAGAELDVECETTDHPSGFPILKRMKRHAKIFYRQNKGTIETTTETDYDLEVNGSVPDSEFTLSAFGLPEPPGMEPVKKPIPWYLWFLLAAGICGAISLAFRHLARRNRVAAAT